MILHSCSGLLHEIVVLVLLLTMTSVALEVRLGKTHGIVFQMTHEKALMGLIGLLSLFLLLETRWNFVFSGLYYLCLIDYWHLVWRLQHHLPLGLARLDFDVVLCEAIAICISLDGHIVHIIILFLLVEIEALARRLISFLLFFSLLTATLALIVCTLSVLLFANLITFAFEDIIFKYAFFYFATGERHLAKAMLDAVEPLAFVNAAVDPFHAAKSVSFIFPVLSFVDVAAGPGVDALAMLLILLVLSFVRAALRQIVRTAPLALAVPLTMDIVAIVALSVLPSVDASAVHFALFVLSDVGVTAC